MNLPPARGCSVNRSRVSVPPALWQVTSRPSKSTSSISPHFEQARSSRSSTKIPSPRAVFWSSAIRPAKAARESTEDVASGSRFRRRWPGARTFPRTGGRFVECDDSFLSDPLRVFLLKALPSAAAVSSSPAQFWSFLPEGALGRRTPSTVDSCRRPVDARRQVVDGPTRMPLGAHNACGTLRA